ncbi:MAG: glycosyltransferase family 4 protein [marine benthic group bacterium]|nr:glycosyltransferase family 4 protein [Gemmatimonadota bacterium]
MRIIIIEPVGEGGMVHFAYQLCSALAAEGADVVLITATEYELEALPHNFTVERLMRLWPRYDAALTRSPPRSRIGRIWRKVWWTARRGTRAVRLLREWTRVIVYVRREGADVVQFGHVLFPGARFFLSRLHGMTLAQICHEFEFRESRYRWSDRIRTRLIRRAYEPFDAVLVLGEEVRSRFHRTTGVPRERIHVIRHGNEELLTTASNDPSAARRRYGLSPDDRVILFFGAIRPSKGVPELIESFAALNDLEDVKLLVVGYPARNVNVNDFRRQAEELGVSSRVLFDTRYIPIDEIGPLMALANVVAFPYRTATQSGAIQVAFAAGRPVVATAVGSIPEAVENGTTGILVSQGASEEMAHALRHLLTNPDVAEKMGRAAREQSAARFGWRDIARDVLSVYESLGTTDGAEPGTTPDPLASPLDQAVR